MTELIHAIDGLSVQTWLAIIVAVLIVFRR